MIGYTFVLLKPYVVRLFTVWPDAIRAYVYVLRGLIQNHHVDPDDKIDNSFVLLNTIGYIIVIGRCLRRLSYHNSFDDPRIVISWTIFLLFIIPGILDQIMWIVIHRNAKRP